MAGASMFDFQPGQAEAMVRGIASAVGGDDGLTPTQASVLGAISRVHLRPRHPGRPARTDERGGARGRARPGARPGRGAGDGHARDRLRAGDARARGARRQLREDARRRRAHAAGGARLLEGCDGRRAAGLPAQLVRARVLHAARQRRLAPPDGAPARRRQPARSRARGEVEDARSVPGGFARPHGVGLLPTSRVLAPGFARFRRPAARAARLRALRRRLRYVGHR